MINGSVKYYYDNGKISSEGLMKDAKPDGYWKNYYKNGKIKIEGNRKNYKLKNIPGETVRQEVIKLEEKKNKPSNKSK